MDLASEGRPAFVAPALAGETNFHVFGPAEAYPYGGDLRYKPPHAPLEDYLKLAAHLGIDLTRSWFVGDRPSDVAPARRLGGRGLLVLTGQGARHREQAEALGVAAVPDLKGAVDTIMKDRPAR